MDMVRSMLSYSTLPISLWMEALKTAVHILNRVPSKSVPAAVTPMTQGNVVAEPVADSPVPMTATPIVDSPMREVDEELEPVFQEPITNHEEEQQKPPVQDVPHNEPPRRSQRARRLAISNDYEVYVSEEIQMQGDPTSFEEAMRSAHSSKWLDAMEDEMRYMSANKVWDLEEIPKGAKTVGCKLIYKTKCDSNGNIERFKP
jgi:hypothetical protein